MRVIVNSGRRVMWGGRSHKAGAVLDVPEKVAERWLYAGDVDLVDEPVVPPALPLEPEQPASGETDAPPAEPEAAVPGEPATPAVDEASAVEELTAVAAPMNPEPEPAPKKRNKRSR